MVQVFYWTLNHKIFSSLLLLPVCLRALAVAESWKRLQDTSSCIKRIFCPLLYQRHGLTLCSLVVRQQPQCGGSQKCLAPRATVDQYLILDTPSTIFAGTSKICQKYICLIKHGIFLFLFSYLTYIDVIIEQVILHTYRPRCCRIELQLKSDLASFGQLN